MSGPVVGEFMEECCIFACGVWCVYGKDVQADVILPGKVDEEGLAGDYFLTSGILPLCGVFVQDDGYSFGIRLGRVRG